MGETEERVGMVGGLILLLIFGLVLSYGMERRTERREVR